MVPQIANATATPNEAKFLQLSRRSAHRFAPNTGIGRHRVDFVCQRCGLCVEIDGGYHSAPRQQALDEIRTQYLMAKGYRVVRILNSDVTGPSVHDLGACVRPRARRDPMPKRSQFVKAARSQGISREAAAAAWQAARHPR